MKELKYRYKLKTYLRENFITTCAKSWRGGSYELYYRFGAYQY